MKFAPTLMLAVVLMTTPQTDKEPAPPSYGLPLNVMVPMPTGQEAVELDCALVVYRGHSMPSATQSELFQQVRKAGIKRLISYPESYTPVLIPEDEVERVKELLGRNRCLRLSPELE